MNVVSLQNSVKRKAQALPAIADHREATAGRRAENRL